MSNTYIYQSTTKATSLQEKSKKKIAPPLPVLSGAEGSQQNPASDAGKGHPDLVEAAGKSIKIHPGTPGFRSFAL